MHGDDGVDLDGGAFGEFDFGENAGDGGRDFGVDFVGGDFEEGLIFFDGSPAFLSHLVMVPSKIDSPIWGMMTSVGMNRSLRDAAPAGFQFLPDYKSRDCGVVVGAVFRSWRLLVTSRNAGALRLRLGQAFAALTPRTVPFAGPKPLRSG